ncbi:hypothetical protein WJX72_009352 [[Myrmecia] bisecta]|uniref:Peptidase S49 domain-containing protein n=1 Tax=[Myrmecia] bisecta TaxID=41462 RepID=A0AAW1R7S5_9CHLO
MSGYAMAFRGLRRVVVAGSATVGVITIGTVFAAYQASKRAKQAVLQLPSEFVLQLDLESKQLVEAATPMSLNQALAGAPPQLQVSRVVQALHHAGGDHRVKGLLAIIGGSQSLAGLAHAQELREAVLEFRRKTGNQVPTTAYADSYGEYGTEGTSTYYFASAFDKVLMQPTGFLSTTGLAAATPFFRRFLDRWRITPNIFARGEYKNAANPFTESGFTKPHREATKGLLDGMIMHVHADVAEARGLSLKEVQMAFDKAPMLASEGVRSGLLSATAYKDEALKSVGAQAPGHTPSAALTPPTPLPSQGPTVVPDPVEGQAAGARQQEGLPVVNLSRYLAAMDASLQQRVSPSEYWGRALKTWRSMDDPEPALVLPVATAGGRPVVALITADPYIKAVVLRIDSPGGSAVASDTIHREMVRLKAAGKPVIVSMGNVAASGGYYIAAPATKILASPATITGSIGVLMGKLNVGGLLQDQGINVETITAGGRNADAMSPFKDFAPDQRAQLNALIDAVYQEFLDRVASGRSMAMADVKRIAKGRVWTGSDALELGLVDQLGGLQDAIKVAKQAAGLPTEDEAAVLVQPYPPPKPLFVQIMEYWKDTDAGVSASARLGHLASSGALLAALLGSSDDLEGLIMQAAQRASMHSAGSRLRMPDPGLEHVRG